MHKASTVGIRHLEEWIAYTLLYVTFVVSISVFGFGKPTQTHSSVYIFINEYASILPGILEQW